MDNNTVIDQLSTEVDSLMRICRGLAAHVDRGQPGISQLRTAIQSLDEHIQILSRQISLDQTQNLRRRSQIRLTVSLTLTKAGGYTSSQT